MKPMFDNNEKEHLAYFREKLGRLSDPVAVLQCFFAHAPFPFQILNLKGQSVVVNCAYKDLFGEPNPQTLIFEDPMIVAQGLEEHVRRAFQGEYVLAPIRYVDPNSPVCQRNPTGKQLAVDAHLFPIKNADGTLEYVAVALHDVTASVLASEKLRESKVMLETAQTVGRMGTWIVDFRDGESIYSSMAASQLYGLEGLSPEKIGHEFWRRIHPEDAALLKAKRDESFATGEPYELEYRFQMPDSSWRWVTSRASWVQSRGHRSPRLVGIVQDIHDRKLTELAAAKNEKRFRILFDSSLLGIFVTKADGVVVEANDEYLRMLKYSRDDLHARRISWITITPEEWKEKDAQYLDKILVHGFIPGYEKEYIRSDGTRFPVMVGGTIVDGSDGEMLCFAFDLSEMKRLQEQLAQSQRLESLGRLAGGVAHDFNNLLGIIILSVDRLIPKIPTPDRLPDALVIRQTAERAAELVRQLLAFSSHRIQEKRQCHLPTVILGMTSLMQRLVGLGIRIETQVDETAEWLALSSIQLEQILMNLIINARDALGQDGLIEIESKAMDLAIEQIENLQLRVQKPGRYARISVSDNGSGMANETMLRIFEPFFSTKPKGEGTGLGLSLVYGIIREAEGDIKVDSVRRKGTQFSIYLPLLTQVSVASAEKKASLQSNLRGQELILLVEDEDELRFLIADLLRSSGYQVIEAQTGLQAIELLKAQQNKVDLVITDVIMPKMSGPALIKKLEEAELLQVSRVLFLSGYSANELPRGTLENNCRQFLEKPFKSEALLKKVRSCLDTPVESKN